MAPNKVQSIWPPLIIANDSLELKKDAPFDVITVYLAGSTKSASSSPGFGYPPNPKRPFSLYKDTLYSFGIKIGTKVGIPIPKFKYYPSSISYAALFAILTLNAYLGSFKLASENPVF